MRRIGEANRAILGFYLAVMIPVGLGGAGHVVAQSPPDPTLNAVSLDQRLGTTVPLHLNFTNEKGNTIELQSLFDNKPVILAPVFYRCPMLCSQILNALVRTIAGQTLTPGVDFSVVVFSFDPRETPQLAAEKKLEYLRRMPRPEARQGWHFLVGKPGAIRELTDAIGYRYAYDAENDQFAHPAAVAILTADGKVSRYLVGLDYDSKDLRLSLVEASKGTVGNIVDQVLLRCYRYDPQRGRYGFAIMTAVRLGGLVTLVTMGAGLVWMSRHKRAPSETEPTDAH